MKKPKPGNSSEDDQQMRPGLTLESRENQLVSLAVDLAEKQLRDGTASSQVISHYLKIGSTREQSEKKILAKQCELMDAKISAMKSAEQLDAVYKEALKAMRIYSGGEDPEDED